jgi:hypothetical protein
VLILAGKPLNSNKGLLRLHKTKSKLIGLHEQHRMELHQVGQRPFGFNDHFQDKIVVASSGYILAVSEAVLK